MMVAESRLARRLIGRLDRGADVLSALIDVCRERNIRAGELRATGAFEQVVLAEWDQRARVYRPQRRFDASFEIVTLYGNVSEREGKPFVNVRVSLSRERDNGIEMVGGQLVGGRVFTLEFVIDAWDDLILRRLPDAQTGLPLWREAVSTVSAAASSETGDQTPATPHVPFDAPARTQWKDVMAASADLRVEEPVTENDPPPPPLAGSEHAKPVAGDFLEHPKFGRVQVERIEGDYEFVSARLRNQRLIRLSLDVIALELVGNEGEHQLFRVLLGQ
jgi:predicted DNA-binding protein with PD1-like motif